MRPIPILDEPPSVEALTRILKEEPGHQPVPPMGDEVWEKAGGKPLISRWIKLIRPLALQDLETEPPVLTDELYARFYKDGDRAEFESTLAQIQARLGRATLLALLLPGEAEQWLRLVELHWRKILARESWSVPAHVKTPSGKNPRALDLVVAGTANQVATLKLLFGEAVPRDLIQATEARINQNLLPLYLEQLESEPWRWYQGSSNWNAVCHHGVLRAAMVFMKDPGDLARLMLKVADGLRFYTYTEPPDPSISPREFRGSFASDGGCKEGPAYWNYGFGHFAWANQHLELRSNGRLTLFNPDHPIFARVAEYGANVLLPGRGWINFADSPPYSTIQAPLYAYLGERLDVEACSQVAAHRFAEMARIAEAQIEGNTAEAAYKPNARHENDVAALTRLCLFAPDTLEEAPPRRPASLYYPKLQVWTSHCQDNDRLWSVAIKGGHNNELHNHADCGSFFIALNGESLAVEAGAPEYHGWVFNKRYRYRNLTIRTLGHSLPIINGMEQGIGPEFYSEILEADHAKDGGGRVRIDLAPSYPKAAKVKALLRTLEVYPDPFRVVVTDDVELHEPGQFESAVVATGIMEKELEVVRIKNQEGTLRLDADEGCFADRIEAHPFRQGGQDKVLWRAVYRCEAIHEGALTGRVRIEFVPEMTK